MYEYVLSNITLYNPFSLTKVLSPYFPGYLNENGIKGL